MSPIKSGLSLFVAGLAVTVLVALFAGSAHGEKGAFWTVNGAKISEFLRPEVAVVPLESHVKLLGSVGKAINKFHIVCNIAENAANSRVLFLEPNGGFTITLKKFTGCIFKRLKTETTEEELKSCEPHEGAEKGVISLKPLKGLINLNGEGAGILVLEPTEGTALFKVELGEFCVFGEELSFNGKLELRDGEGTFSTEQIKHLLEGDPNSTKLLVNNSEANTAHIDFKLRFFLTGVHAGLTWAGHPA